MSKANRLMARLLAEGRAVIKKSNVPQDAGNADRARYYRAIFASNNLVHAEKSSVILPAEAVKSLQGVAALGINAFAYARFLKAMSNIQKVKDRFFQLGLWGEITPAALISKHNDVFEKTGGLTLRRNECMFATLHSAGMSPNDTTAIEYLTSKVAKPRLFDVLGLSEPSAKEKDMSKLPQNAFPIVLREFQEKFAREQERLAAIRATEKLSIQST